MSVCRFSGSILSYQSVLTPLVLSSLNFVIQYMILNKFKYLRNFVIVIDLTRQEVFRTQSPSPWHLLDCTMLQQLRIRPTDQYFMFLH